jgi:putative Mn2+ efflux pump MntP
MERKEISTSLPNSSKQTVQKAIVFGCLFLLFEILTLAAGIGIWMIFHGLWMAGSRMVVYWRPAREWIASFFKLEDERYRQMLPMTWYRWIYAVMYFLAGLFFVFLGAKMLIQNGFLEQNIIYWFTK